MASRTKRAASREKHPARPRDSDGAKVGQLVGKAVRRLRTVHRLTLWVDPGFANYFWSIVVEVAADLGGGVPLDDPTGL